MILEIIFILALIALQLYVFSIVFSKIKSYEKFFPSSFKEINIKKFFINKEILNDSEKFEKYLDTLSNDEQKLEDLEDPVEIELLVISKSTVKSHSHFSEVIKSTNAYLCKNKGASADFSILKDTCKKFDYDYKLMIKDNNLLEIIHRGTNQNNPSIYKKK
jgi:hypothetical protein